MSMLLQIAQRALNRPLLIHPRKVQRVVTPPKLYARRPDTKPEHEPIASLRSPA
jgi:hypothetical protein